MFEPEPTLSTLPTEDDTQYWLPPVTMEAEPTQPTVATSPAEPKPVPPSSRPPGPPKMKQRKIAPAKQNRKVGLFQSYAVTKASEHPLLDRAYMQNCLMVFTKDLDLRNYCVGFTEDSINVYLKFRYPVAHDHVAGLMMSESPTGKHQIYALESKTKIKNFLTNIYKNDHMPGENLASNEKHLVPFDLLLPAFLSKYADKPLDLQDDFLLKFAPNFAYIAARVSSQAPVKTDGNLIKTNENEM